MKPYPNQQSTWRNSASLFHYSTQSTWQNSALCLPFMEGCAGANNKASPPGRHQEQASKQRCIFRPTTFSSVQFSSKGARTCAVDADTSSSVLSPRACQTKPNQAPTAINSPPTVSSCQAFLTVLSFYYFLYNDFQWSTIFLGDLGPAPRTR